MRPIILFSILDVPRQLSSRVIGKIFRSLHKLYCEALNRISASCASISISKNIWIIVCIARLASTVCSRSNCTSSLTDIGMHGERLMRSDLLLTNSNNEDAIRIAFELIDLLNGVVMLSLSDALGNMAVTPENLFSSNAAHAKLQLSLPSREPALSLTGMCRDESNIPIPQYVEPEFGLFRDVFQKQSSTDDCDFD